MRHKNTESATIDGVTYCQSDFLDILDKNEATPSTLPQIFPIPSPLPTTAQPKTPLPKKQVMGFRQDYDDATITLYIIECLLKGYQEDEKPEEIKHLFEKAQKTKARYERYNPRAKQSHYGRDVVNAYIYSEDGFLSSLRKKAENAKYPHSLWHTYSYAIDTVNKISAIIRDHNFRNK